jgi:hypothetical protein
MLEINFHYLHVHTVCWTLLCHLYSAFYQRLLAGALEDQEDLLMLLPYLLHSTIGIATLRQTGEAVDAFLASDYNQMANKP